MNNIIKIKGNTEYYLEEFLEDIRDYIENNFLSKKEIEEVNNKCYYITRKYYQKFKFFRLIFYSRKKRERLKEKYIKELLRIKKGIINEGNKA